MNRKDEQTASKTQAELVPLLVQEIWSHSIEIPPGTTNRWPQSLFDPNGSSQDARVDSYSAPTFSQNQETAYYSVNPNELREAVLLWM